ncbi:MAG: hypothetical protein ACI8R4_001978, partial [Paracoccaceae bacterium]
MTTHILTGIAVYSDTISDVVLSIDSTDVTQKFVVPDTVTTLSYSEVPTFPGVPSLAEFSVDAYHVWLENKKYQPPEFPDYSIVAQLNWTDASGIARATTVLDYIELGTNVAGLGVVDVE